MKIREIIREGVKETAQSVVEILLRDCRPFLAAVDYDLRDPLVRGVQIAPTSIVAVKTNKNRKPVDMPQIVTDAIDDYFQETTGVRWRTTSVFATSNEHAAMFYGPLYAVFPIGEFHYCWSQRVSDLFNNLDNQLSKYKLRYRSFQENLDVMGEESAEDAANRKLAFELLHDTIMPGFGYQVDTDIKEAMAMANSEVMILCDKYYLVGTHIINQVRDLIKANTQ